MWRDAPPAEVAKDPCPLRCGRSWHGLPKDRYGNTKACSGPWPDAPAQPDEVVVEGPEPTEVTC